MIENSINPNYCIGAHPLHDSHPRRGERLIAHHNGEQQLRRSGTGLQFYQPRLLASKIIHRMIHTPEG